MIKEIREQFDKYTSAYNLDDVKIKLKYEHTYRVAENCKLIAESIGLSDVDVKLAWAIGMLHDIGRFEQVKRYGTFIDRESIDHAVFGADLLFKEGLKERFLKMFCGNDLDVIEKAIRSHNAFILPEDYSEREVLFANIIRDADKVDIFRVISENTLEELYNVSEAELANFTVTERVMQCVYDEETVLFAYRQNPLDNMVGHFCLIYGLVFDKSKEMARSQGYYDKLLSYEPENATAKVQFDEIRKKINSFACLM